MKRPFTQRLTRARIATRLAAAACPLAVALLALLALLARPVPAAPPAAAGPSCAVSVASGIAFGAYDPLAPAALDSTGRVVLDCPPGRIVSISLGTGQSGSFAARELRGPTGEALRYNLYRDAARTQVWGDGSSGVALSMDGAKGKTVQVYARVFAGQDVSAGAYADTIVLTVEF